MNDKIHQRRLIQYIADIIEKKDLGNDLGEAEIKIINIISQIYSNHGLDYIPDIITDIDYDKNLIYIEINYYGVITKMYKYLKL